MTDIHPENDPEKAPWFPPDGWASRVRYFYPTREFEIGTDVDGRPIKRFIYRATASVSLPVGTDPSVLSTCSATMRCRCEEKVLLFVGGWAWVSSNLSPPLDIYSVWFDTGPWREHDEACEQGRRIR